MTEVRVSLLAIHSSRGSKIAARADRRYARSVYRTIQRLCSFGRFCSVERGNRRVSRLLVRTVAEERSSVSVSAPDQLAVASAGRAARWFFERIFLSDSTAHPSPY